MKLKLTIISIFLIGFISESFSQSKILKGKVFDENKDPVENLTIRFVSLGEITTTNSGEFEFEVPADLSFVEIEVNDKNWSIISPLDNRLPIPSDELFTAKIFLVYSEKEDDDMINRLADKMDAIEVLLKELGFAKEREQQMLEELKSKLSENFNFKIEDFQNAIEAKKKRDALFSDISQELSEFNLAINDVNTMFKNINIYAAEDNMALDELVLYINKYNKVFSSLTNNKFDHYNLIESLWSNPELAEEYMQTVNYAIDEIHKPYILRLNETIVVMNKINRKIITDDDEVEELKTKIKTEIETVVKELERRLPVLDRKIEAILLKLKE